MRTEDSVFASDRLWQIRRSHVCVSLLLARVTIAPAGMLVQRFALVEAEWHCCLRGGCSQKPGLMQALE